MLARLSFDYSIVRVVPRVDRGEQLNAGVIVWCLKQDFLGAAMALDEARLTSLWPRVDLDAVRAHLAAIPKICAGDADAGPIAKLTKRERWHWLVAPRSTIVQTSPVHVGLCDAPDKTLAHLLAKLVSVET